MDSKATPSERAMNGVGLIAAERERQVTKEGWTHGHDDLEDGEGLALAAVCYALPAKEREMTNSGVWHAHGQYQTPKQWPWEPSWYKPTPEDRIKELAKAGALIAAEIDRLQRASPPPLYPQDKQGE